MEPAELPGLPAFELPSSDDPAGPPAPPPPASLPLPIPATSTAASHVGRSSRRLWVTLVVTVAALSGTVGFALKEHEAREAYGVALNAATAQADSLATELRAARAEASALAGARARAESELEETRRRAAAAAQEAERVRNELRSGLEPDIQKGTLVVRDRGEDVVIDVSEEVLFDTGMAEIGARGKQVLLRVAKALVQQPSRVLEVSGHTDDSPIVSRKVRDRYPTNWELSTARATAVVRFLEQQCGVPGNRLAAAGYAQHRPKVSNVNDEGRTLNRRIEIALLEAPPAPEAPLPVVSAAPESAVAVSPGARAATRGKGPPRAPSTSKSKSRVPGRH